jgi:hypothetical protein
MHLKNEIEGISKDLLSEMMASDEFLLHLIKKMRQSIKLEVSEKRSEFRWSKDEIHLLGGLFFECIDYEEIAQMLSRSRDSILSQLIKIGFLDKDGKGFYEGSDLGSDDFYDYIDKLGELDD